MWLACMQVRGEARRGAQNPEVRPAAVEVVLKFLVVKLGDSLLLVIARRKLHNTLHTVPCCVWTKRLAFYIFFSFKSGGFHPPRLFVLFFDTMIVSIFLQATTALQSCCIYQRRVLVRAHLSATRACRSHASRLSQIPYVSVSRTTFYHRREHILS